mmetsp:Transcript_26037/g.65076  ORF Transcript_26037/g.65076 Transcript_26037/m.65076 type:complete len:231 (+) Transcript_26037:1635-2327(+)
MQAEAVHVLGVGFDAGPSPAQAQVEEKCVALGGKMVGRAVHVRPRLLNVPLEIEEKAHEIPVFAALGGEAHLLAISNGLHGELLDEVRAQHVVLRPILGPPLFKQPRQHVPQALRGVLRRGRRARAAPPGFRRSAVRGGRRRGRKARLEFHRHFLRRGGGGGGVRVEILDGFENRRAQLGLGIDEVDLVLRYPSFSGFDRGSHGRGPACVGPSMDRHVIEPKYPQAKKGG